MDHLDNSTSTDYGPGYYRKHCGPLPYDRSSPHWGIFFGGIAEMLIRSFQPRRVFDAGCALGFLVEAFWDRGVEAWGRDISDFAISEVRVDLRSFCSVGSIADPIEGRFDLITCIEVLEHIPEATAIQAVKSMAVATDRILLSTSPTDLEEPTHVNVKPPIWWLRLFAAEGFAPLLSYDPTYITPHCIVFERVPQPPGEQILLGYAEIIRLRLQRAEREEIISDATARAQGRDELERELERLRHESALQLTQAEAAAQQERDHHREELARETTRASQAEHTCNVLEAEIETLRQALEHAAAAAQNERLSHAGAVTALRNSLMRAEEDHRRIVTSTSWRLSYPLRRLAERTTPKQRRLVRSSLLIVWWTLTLQLRSRLRQRRQAKQGLISRQAAADSDGSEGGLSGGGTDPALDLEAGWYLAQNPDVAAAGLDARQHYQRTGMAEGRSWGLPPATELTQQANWYLLQNPEVAATGVEPFQHFLKHGLLEGRAWPATRPSADEIAADMLPWVRLLNLSVDPAYADRPALNVLIPSLAMKSMSGGPNTAVNLACRLAATGIRVRLVSVNAPPDADPSAFWKHATKLAGFDPRDHGVELINAWYRAKPFRIGENDLFMATAWWTAQAAKYAVRHTGQKRFLYLIQDYECLMHPASTEQALAEESYQLDYLPIINTRLLHEFLTANKVGRFIDPEFSAEALTFEPAVDTTLFFPVTPGKRAGHKRKRLLFYARPTFGLRNLFGLGVAVLRKLVAEGVITQDGWEIRGMGEAFDAVPLGANCWLEALPWSDFPTYAEQMRESDVLLSLMMSPHPSYPPLEMAACGRPVVTTVFSNKDAAHLASISPNIIGVKATLEAIAEGLVTAMQRGPTAHKVDLPATWSQSLDSVLPQLRDGIMHLQGAPACRPVSERQAEPGEPTGLFPGFHTWPAGHYGIYRQRMLADRSNGYTNADPTLVSFITPVWNTPPQFLFELAAAVFGQDSGPGFEWVILDNGSTRQDTCAALAEIAANPAVRLVRQDNNSGIIPGLHSLLEHATRRYIVPLDHDDLITPDCVRVMTSALRQAEFPSFAYSDEDKVMDGEPRDPYCKPDWDPVLFTHSCYTAHLCAMDRQIAIQLGCYTNRGSEGSPDWDSFTRFMLAGHTPLHVPELLYTWRMHPQSTAMDIGSKSYIHDSQLSVLRTFLAGRQATSRYTVELSPLFNKTPDWRFVRHVEGARPITTILFGPGADAYPLSPQFEGHRIERLETADLAALLEHARGAVAEHRYLHLLSPDVTIDDQSWADEALTMFELYPGTAMVGGRIHRDGIVVAADGYFGFDGGCGSPNSGRLLSDTGYFVQPLKPHAASSVPIQHCLIDPGFAADVLPELIRARVGTSHLSAWFGAAARTRHLRCVYTPFLSAQSKREIDPPDTTEITAFSIAYAALIPDRILLSPRLGLTRSTAYQPVLRAERTAQEQSLHALPQLPYPEQHAAELMARRLVTAPPTVDFADVSLLTAVYIRSDAVMFRAAAASLMTQTLPFREWLILAQGPISPELEQALVELAQDERISILRCPQNLGIMNGMRLCLEAARGLFVAPMDADDLLTVDALQLVTEALTQNDGVDFVFSDEDIIYQGELRSPIRRTDFDPILNDADSTIWHFCAFNRERALQLGVYSDTGAEACHDWDTAQRFSMAGAFIRHLPQVLYHWRHHPASTSASGAVSKSSLRSVQHVLSGIIGRQNRPTLYQIKPYPLFRGVEQFAILRRHVEPLPHCLIYVVQNIETPTVPQHVLNALPVNENRILVRDPASGEIDAGALAAALQDVTSEYLVFLNQELQPSGDEGPWDAMRLFEMHADVAAVSGRILDAQNRVVACAETLAGPEVAREWVGRPSSDPGAHALALKPQTAKTITEGYFFCRAALLRTAPPAANPGVPLAQLVTAAAHRLDMRLAYSPLVEAAYTDAPAKRT